MRSVSTAATAYKFFDKAQMWKSACLPEAQAVLDLIRAMVFGPKHDSQLKNLLKSGKTPEEIMGTSPFSEDVTAIESELGARDSGVAE